MVFIWIPNAKSANKDVLYSQCNSTKNENKVFSAKMCLKLICSYSNCSERIGLASFHPHSRTHNGETVFQAPINNQLKIVNRARMASPLFIQPLRNFHSFHAKQITHYRKQRGVSERRVRADAN